MRWHEESATAPETARIGPAPHIAVTWQGAGPLVVFLHGMGGNRSNWRAQLPVFGGYFTAVAWDARGYGDSDDYDGPLHFADFSADLARVLDYFGAEKAHLVGLSMGGRIALDFYGRCPQRVATLVLADTSVARRGAAKEEQIAEALRVRKRPLLEGKSPRDIAPEMAQRLAGPNVTLEQYQKIVASLAALRKESYLKTLESVVRYDGFPPFSSITVPCLVLAGAADAIATPPVVAAMAASIPGATLVVLDNAGHLSNIENPAAFNDAVLAFLRHHTLDVAP